MKWKDAFNLAKQYYGEHGDLLVPLEYQLDGYSLGRWIEWQRRRCSVAMKQHEEKEVQRSQEIIPPLLCEEYSKW